MEARKVLALLGTGSIKELENLCREELFTNTLSTKTGAKLRYSAMKRYLKGVTMRSDMFGGVGVYKEYNAFCNGYSAVITKEDIGELPRFDSTKGEYIKLDSIMDIQGVSVIVDTAKIFAKAASLGYKYKVSEKKYLLHIEEAYFNFTLFDKAFSIIRDTDDTDVVLPKNKKSPVLLKTKLGECVILPVNVEITSYDYKIIEID